MRFMGVRHHSEDTALKRSLALIAAEAPAKSEAHCTGYSAGGPVGTVDKFQGQEAPVVFFSMTSSSGEDVPRNIEFLFSHNRLNVAVSRARCLAILVASPKLLDLTCRTVEQMRLVNALCRFVEIAETQAGSVKNSA
jgi:hypothetical protein